MLKEIFNKANCLTFIGLAVAVIGIQLSLKGQIDIAVLCLLFCGICDGFDGTFAKKIRKNGDEKFGVELDSLVDIVSSGVFPVIIGISMNYTNIVNMIIYCIFIICGVARLAYYNVNSSDTEHFSGVPITMSSIIIPIIYVVSKSKIVFMITFLLLAISFILPIKIKKLKLKERIIFVIIIVVVIGVIGGINGSFIK